MKRMIIIRGISGVGKTTMANAMKEAWRKLAEEPKRDVTLCSADDFFTKSDGTYAYVPSQIGQAHQICMCSVIEAIAEDKDVIIHNTFSKRWELESYVKLGKLHKYNILILAIMPENEEQLQAAIRRSQHAVPEEIIRRMHSQFEHFERVENLGCHCEQFHVEMEDIMYYNVFAFSVLNAMGTYRRLQEFKAKIEAKRKEQQMKIEFNGKRTRFYDCDTSDHPGFVPRSKVHKRIRGEDGNLYVMDKDGHVFNVHPLQEQRYDRPTNRLINIPEPEWPIRWQIASYDFDKISHLF